MPAATWSPRGVAGATNLDQVISNHAVAESGTYSLRVTSPTRTRYGLVVTRNAAFDTEANDTFATAQPLGSSGALGAITPGTDGDAGRRAGRLANVEGKHRRELSIGTRGSSRSTPRTEFSGASVIDAIRFRRDDFYPAFTSPDHRQPPDQPRLRGHNRREPLAGLRQQHRCGLRHRLRRDVNLTSPGTGSPEPVRHRLRRGRPVRLRPRSRRLARRLPDHLRADPRPASSSPLPSTPAGTASSPSPIPCGAV